MRLITIQINHESMIVHEGKLPKARLVWKVTDQIEVWVKGPFGGLRYEQASNLALQVVIGMNIPVISLRRAK